tara:strand:+ start:262 stop:1533 length:1272 start_codon:yes stop_codon:yes gene_type:complete
MSDENMLSQDEIDALLQGDLGLDELEEDDENFGGSGTGGGSGSGDGGSGVYTAEQIRVLHEVVDSCFISEINVLSEYVQQEVALSNSKTPELVTEEDLKGEVLSTQHIFMTFDFEQGKSGIVLGGIPSAMIAALMTGEEWDGDPDFEWDDLKLSALQDCFNGLLSKLVPALKTATGQDFVGQQPQAIVLSGSDFPPEATLLKQKNIAQIAYDLNVGEEPASQFRFLVSENLAKTIILSKLPDTTFGSEEAGKTATPQADAGNVATDNASVPGQAVNPSNTAQPQPVQPAVQQQAQMMPPQQGQMPVAQMNASGGQQMPYAPWQFAPISSAPMGQDQLSNMELLRDVTLQITVELGRAKMPIGEILELVNGSIVELNKQAGEAVELYVQGKLIARGEVVIIDENFGIRITSIVSPQERLTTVRS